MSVSSSRESEGHRPCGGLAQRLRAGNRAPPVQCLPSGPAPALGSHEWLSPLPGRPQPVCSMTPGPKFHRSSVQGRMWSSGPGSHAWPLGTAPTGGQERIDPPLGTDHREEQGLLPHFRGSVTRNKGWGGGIQSVLDQSLVFVFCF